jgi:hypothetical protein
VIYDRKGSRVQPGFAAGGSARPLSRHRRHAFRAPRIFPCDCPAGPPALPLVCV